MKSWGKKTGKGVIAKKRKGPRMVLVIPEGSSHWTEKYNLLYLLCSIKIEKIETN